MEMSNIEKEVISFPIAVIRYMPKNGHPMVRFISKDWSTKLDFTVKDGELYKIVDEVAQPYVLDSNYHDKLMDMFNGKAEGLQKVSRTDIIDSQKQLYKWSWK